MTPRERRTFVLAAVLLLAASLVRWSFGPGRDPPLLPPDSAGVLDTLLAETAGAVADARRRAEPLATGERIDPNRAPAAELDRLPGVGPTVAGAIVEEREEGGGFASMEDIQRVRGIGPALARRMAPHLDLSHRPPSAGRGGAGHGAPLPVGYRRITDPAGKKGDFAPTVAGGRGAPLDLNRATSAELEELRGVGPALAERILALRRKKGTFRRVEELLQVPGIGPVTLERLELQVRAGP